MNIWPFNRRKNQSTDIPQEVQDYYQAEKRERVGVAGLLALGTLLATIVLAIGLFFGGRLVYRSLFDSSDNGQVATQNQADNEQQQEQPSTPAAPAPEPEPAPAPQQDKSTPKTPARTNTRSDDGKEAEDLPNTGPASTMTIFLATVLISSYLYYRLKPTVAE